MVTEDIVLASLGTHFMHMRGKLPQKLVKMNGSLCFLQAAIVGLIILQAVIVGLLLFITKLLIKGASVSHFIGKMIQK